MTVPTPTIDTLPAPDRKKITGLLAERAMFGLVFSYKKLLKVIGSVDEISACIAAADDDETKENKKLLNDSITEVLSVNGIKSVRGPDQFGMVRDLIYKESAGSPSISRTRLLELAPKFGISINKAQDWIEAATTRTPWATVECRRVKSKE